MPGFVRRFETFKAHDSFVKPLIVTDSQAYGSLKTPLLDWSPWSHKETYSGSGTRTSSNNAGTLVTLAANAIRDDNWVTDNTGIFRRTTLLELASTNKVRNPNGVGAVAGVLGSGGALPTNWVGDFSSLALATEIVSVGIEAGYRYVDIRVYGTPSGTATTGIEPESSTYAAAASGESWAASGAVRLVGGAVPSSVFLALVERNGSGGFLAGSTVALLEGASSLASARVQVARTFNQATTAYASLRLQFSVSAGVAVDFTFRIAHGQLEKQPVATSPVPGPPDGALADTTRAVDIATLPFPTEIQEMSGMVEFVEGGTASIDFARLFEIGAASTTAPRLLVQVFGGKYRSLLQNSATTTSLGALTVAPSQGDRVRIWWRFFYQGANIVVGLRQSIGSGAFGAEVTGAAMARDFGSWSAPLYTINSSGNGANAGRNHHIRHRVYPGYVPAEAF